MSTTYDVRFWKTEVYRGVRRTTYTVRWTVGGKPWRATYATEALADSFRSELVTAARNGMPFDLVTGRPVRAGRETRTESWYEFACSYVDMKWPDAAGKSRMGIAETLATVTPALLSERRGRPAAANIRAALYGWAFNARARERPIPRLSLPTLSAGWKRIHYRWQSLGSPR